MVDFFVPAPSILWDKGVQGDTGHLMMGRYQMSKTYQEIQEFLFHLNNKVIHDTNPRPCVLILCHTAVLSFLLTFVQTKKKKSIDQSCKWSVYRIQPVDLPLLILRYPQHRSTKKPSSWLHDHQSPTSNEDLNVRIFPRRENLQKEDES